MEKTIKVLVVDDSPVIQEMISRILNKAPDIEVIGLAANGKEAITQTKALKPNIITMDIRMPIMDGYRATARIMAYYPTPILIVAASLDELGLDAVFRALSVGALDVIEKPALKEGWSDMGGFTQELITKVKLLSKVKVISHPLGRIQQEREPQSAPTGRDFSIVAIASSTGGPGALSKILSKLREDFSAGIVIAQHLSEGFIEGLANWLDREARIKVKEAEDGETVKPGVALISPTSHHMKIEPGGRIKLIDSSEMLGIKPSGDILLSSVAGTYGPKAIGIILTGMGSDGAQGLKEIQEKGGLTIAQDELSCVVFGMPKVAIEIGAAERVVPLDLIGGEIMNLVKTVPIL